jgi:hypothetical protein
MGEVVLVHEFVKHPAGATRSKDFLKSAQAEHDRQAYERPDHQGQRQKDLFFTLLQECGPLPRPRLPPPFAGLLSSICQLVLLPIRRNSLRQRCNAQI